MRRERAEAWRDALASGRRLIPEPPPPGTCGGPSVPWLEETDVHLADKLRYLAGDGSDPALPWFRRKLLQAMAARPVEGGAGGERDEDPRSRARGGPREGTPATGTNGQDRGVLP